MTKPRGFAAMTPEQRRAIASKGGQALHHLGLAHRWTSEEASQAGRKGGVISRRRSRQPLPPPDVPGELEL